MAKRLKALSASDSTVAGMLLNPYREASAFQDGDWPTKYNNLADNLSHQSLYFPHTRLLLQNILTFIFLIWLHDHQWTQLSLFEKNRLLVSHFCFRILPYNQFLSEHALRETTSNIAKYCPIHWRILHFLHSDSWLPCEQEKNKKVSSQKWTSSKTESALNQLASTQVADLQAPYWARLLKLLAVIERLSHSRRAGSWCRVSGTSTSRMS